MTSAASIASWKKLRFAAKRGAITLTWSATPLGTYEGWSCGIMLAEVAKVPRTDKWEAIYTSVHNDGGHVRGGLDTPAVAKAYAVAGIAAWSWCGVKVRERRTK